MRTQKTKCQTQQSDMRAEMEQARRVPAPAYSCGELEWIWARINLCTRVDCRATTTLWSSGSCGYFVCVFRKRRSVDTMCINHATSFSPGPKSCYPFSFPSLPFSPQQGPVGGYAMYLSREVLRPVPERVTPSPSLCVPRW